MKLLAICAAGALLAAAGCGHTPVASTEAQSGAGKEAVRGTGTNIARRNRDAQAEGVRGMSAEDVERLKRTGGSMEQASPQIQGRQLK